MDEELRRLERAADAGDAEAVGLLEAARRRLGILGPHVVDDVIAAIQRSRRWQEAWDIARANSKGKVWVVGGKVYRTLAQVLHGRTRGASMAVADACDFDFLAEGTTILNHIPRKWHVGTGGGEYGSSGLRNPYSYKKMAKYVWRYSEGERHVLDLMTLKRASNAGFPETLDGYFSSVPLDVQAVALDVDGRFISGHGVQAVVMRRVGVNNAVEAVAAAARVSESLHAWLLARARSLDFDVDTLTIPDWAYAMPAPSSAASGASSGASSADGEGPYTSY